MILGHESIVLNNLEFQSISFDLQQNWSKEDTSTTFPENM